jgi:hypothetical protein
VEFREVVILRELEGLSYVVAYDYAAARVHITNGETGVLVPCGASQAFMDAAADLTRAPRSLHRMRPQARAHARYRLATRRGEV